MTLHDGGPAFPRQSWDYYPALNKTHAGIHESGMTLRDYFAGRALEGELASQEAESVWMVSSADVLAKRCYAFADAMLAERSLPLPESAREASGVAR